MKLFRNLKITYKLAVILGIVLLAFVVTAFGYKTLLDVNDKAAHKQERLAKFELLIGDVHVGLFQGRAHEKEFFLNKNLTSIDAFEARMTRARESLAALSDVAPEGMDPSEIKNLQERFRAYHGAFYLAAEAQMRLGIDENSGSYGQVRTAIQSLENALKNIEADKLISSVLMMRRHENDFLARGDEKYIAHMAKEQKNFSNLLAKTSFPAARKSEIKNFLAIYKTKFDELVTRKQQVDEEISALERR